MVKFFIFSINFINEIFIKIVEFLDEDIIPPNWELAEKHGVFFK